MSSFEATMNPYTVAQAPASERAMFIRRTYAHLAGAIAGFIGVEFALLQSSLGEAMLQFIGANKYGWLMLLGGFMIAGWLARSLAEKVESIPMQYLGLALYVTAEAVIFLPILYIAANFCGPNVIPMAGLLTALLFGGLTMIVFTTRKDFSFLGSILQIAGFVAIGLIIAGTVFGFNLGLLFSGVMVAIASAAILYDTSKVLHHYRPNQHVAASLALFASVALLFFYILRIIMAFAGRD